MRDAHELNFAWLIRLRWAMVAGQLIVLLGAHGLADVAVPLWPVVAVLSVEAISNLLAQARAAPRPATVFGLLVLDVACLTALLSLLGGPYNPFSAFYLVQVALAAVMLPPRSSAALVLIALAGYGALFAGHRPLEAHHGVSASMDAHLQGMWVAFGISGGFIVYFLHRVTSALAARERLLAQARDRAARADRLTALVTLAAGAAHELSTPLSSIAVLARELERDLQVGDTSDAASDATLIRAEVARCRQVLDRMAANSGAVGGESQQRVEISQLVEQALAPLSGRARVRVEAPAPVWIYTWPHAVGLALRSLVKNGLDASAGEAGEAPVRVRLAVDGHLLRVEVIDAGHGMPPEVLERATDPFFTTKAPDRGIGLGLFVARATAEALGGTLRLVSEPGRGTTATLEIPMRRHPKQDPVIS